MIENERQMNLSNLLPRSSQNQHMSENNDWNCFQQNLNKWLNIFISSFMTRHTMVKMSYTVVIHATCKLYMMTRIKHDDVTKWKYFPRYWPFVAGNSPITGEFPAQRPMTRNFDVSFDLCLNKRLSKQWWGWWSETQSCPLWHCKDDR